MKTQMTRLREALYSRNNELLKYVESLVNRATPQLWHTLSTFQSGTKHTREHTDTVEEIASMLLSDDIISMMKDDEIALLILACHYHDLGMAGTETDNSTETGRDRVRKEHAISIGEKISSRWKELGFDDQNYAEILAEVCRGHRPEKIDGVANWDNLSEYRNLGPNRFVRLRLISSMIYAADELHLGHDRAPKREEEWKEITNIESLRHWRRHQAISGPTKPNDKLVFDVRINTLSFEGDIRKSLKKALLAVADLRRELSSVGITDHLPQIEILWIRDYLWKLLITKVCCDSESRSSSKISKLVLDEFKTGELKFENLDELCSEKPVDHPSILLEIDRTISDFISQEFLIRGAEPNTFQLSSEVRVSKYLLRLTGDADETEQLFARSIDANHEQLFYESETGKKFIRKYVFAEIRKSYAVDISNMPESDPLRTVVESSPMACRILQQLSTPPGNLVKHDLLQFAVTVGMCFDLINKPELFLDKKLRSAIRQIFEKTSVRIPKFMNFIQELAIIKDLSFDQVTAIMLPSIAEKKEYFNDVVDSESINVSQKYPRERPDWAVPYLLLAGQRSQEAISILNTPDAPFHLTTDFKSESSEVESRLNNEQTVYINFNPIIRFPSKSISFRSSVSFEPSQGLLVFGCRKLSSDDQSELPLIITLPSEEPGAELDIKFSFPKTLLNVGNVIDLESATKLSLNNKLEVQIQLEGSGVIAKNIHTPSNPFKIPEVIPEDILFALRDIDTSIPIPLFTRKKLLSKILEASTDNKLEVYNEVLKSVEREKPSVTTIFLRLANTDGQDFKEEFLGILPLGCHFMAPTIVDSKMDQEEVNRFCESGERQWMLSTLFREDFHTLAQEIRDWVKNPEQPFPFKSDTDLQFHYCKTRMEQVHSKHIDRIWYIERPVVFRFCPVNKVEQYRVEMEYWQNSGDEQRAELLAELLKEAEAQIRVISDDSSSNNSNLNKTDVKP